MLYNGMIGVIIVKIPREFQIVYFSTTFGNLVNLTAWINLAQASCGQSRNDGARMKIPNDMPKFQLRAGELE